MALKLITPPAPIMTAIDARQHLNLQSTDFDKTIDLMIAAATGNIDGKDGWLQRSLNPQTYDLVYDTWPCGGAIEIPLPPLISIDSINYFDENGDAKVFSSGSYEVDDVSEPGWVQLGSEFSWPNIINTINAVRVRFTAGYAYASGDVSTVPYPIQQAILMMVGDMFAHRESVTTDSINSIPIPTSVKALLAPYRVFF